MNARKPWSNLISIFYDFKKVANMQFQRRFNQKKLSGRGMEKSLDNEFVKWSVKVNAEFNEFLT